MPFDLALFDLVSPYVLLGDSFGQWHAAFSVIFVDEHSIATDEAGVVIRGVARFSGDVHPYIDPSSMTFGVNAENTEGHPANDPGRRDPWIDIRDAHVDFQLTAPRIASQKVASAVTAIGGAAGFAPSAAVLTALDAIPGDAPPSDYPSTEFVLDLLLTTVILRPPFLKPAKLQPNGQMVEDTTKTSVSISLPRIKVRLAQGSNNNDPLTVDLLSAGATSLDDPGDLGVAQLVTMDPPYAFIGPSKVVGFGFRSATLDLSDGSTPPEILSQFGFDEAWKGLYLPEIRLFIAPHGADDFAVDAGARNLLIGIGASAGVTGDFDLGIIDQGSGKLDLGARFYDNANQSFAITKTSDTTATVSVPDHTRMVVDINGGLTPYTSTVAFDGAAGTTGRVFDCALSAAHATRTIVIDVTDSKSTPNHATLTITANRQPASSPALPGTSATPANPPAVLETTSITQSGSTVPAPRLRLVSETPTTATISLEGDPVPSAHWTVGGTDRGTSTTVTVDLPQGSDVSLQAEVTGASAAGSFTAYYRFDHPSPDTDNNVRAYAQIVDGPGGVRRSTNTVPAVDEGLTADWPGGGDAGSALTPLLASLPTAASIDIKGYASFETGGNQALTYNTDLARRRAVGLEAIIKAHQGVKNFNTSANSDMSHWNPAEQGDPVRNQFWKAVASWSAQPMPGTTTQGHVSRSVPNPNPVTPPPPPDDPRAATPPPPPSWFKEVGAKVRIVRNQFVACEVFGKFDIQTPAENQLRQGGVSNANMPALRRLGNNPADGIIDIRIVVQIDDATDTVTVSGYFGADPADKDGLMMTGALPSEPLAPRDLGRNYLGMAVMFMPLLSAAANAVAGDGALAEIAVTGAVLALPFTLGSLPWVTVERVIWYGGELTVQVRPDGAQGVVLLDLEAAVSLDVTIGALRLIRIKREAPLSVRYKAVGLLIGNPPGQPKFQFRPMFDASKGYTVDVSKPGAIEVADPLGQILRILGARIARNNPLIFEVDLGFTLDLSVISIERARVRLHLDPPGAPELTAFAASINIPGAIKGRGYLEMNEHEIKGQLDLTILPVQVRIAAGMGVAHLQGQTCIIVTLDVEFPVAIPLASSGLGIYGFLGLFAMNYARDESKGVPAAGMAPALAWLRATGGDPTNIDFWKPQVNSWAFGVGAILGTMGSSIVFNLKGVFILELPGPRLLLMMKANLLIPMPERKGNAEGMFLAVIDLDFGRGTLTIGLAIDFNIDPLIRLTIPVEAFFDFNDTSNWHLYLGQYINQIQAKVLQIFDASGYLMLSGNGMPSGGVPPPIGNLPAVTGFSLATGLHVSFTWGGGPLFAQLAAGFDAIIGFSPFRMAGTLTVRGTLHLFIIDISAWADLNVDVGEKVNPDNTIQKISRISGDLCGRIEFLFFSIEGCVSFSLGDSAGAVPDPPPLVKSLKLISRSPALVLGTAVDKPVDAGIGDGIAGGDAEPGGLPIVPIDVIPTSLMVQPPLQAATLQFLGKPIGGTPEAPSDGWVQRGDVWFKYTVKNVELIGPLSTGATPAVWWKPKSGDRALEAQLALLSWVPEATPKAIGSSKYLDEQVTEHWGTVCWPAAPAAPVFWTFLNELLGASTVGWNLTGKAWPDPPKTIRSGPPNLTLHVVERWRCGNATIDKLRGIVPALVEGLPVACPQNTPTQPGIAGVPATNISVVSLQPVPASTPARITATLPAINPISALRGRDIEVLPTETLTVSDVLLRSAAGQQVSRSTLATVQLPTTSPAVNNPPPKCFAKALASPMFDDGEVIAFANQSYKDEVTAAWKRLKFKPGPLDESIVIETGEFVYARFLLYVPLRFIQNVVTVVAVNAAEAFGNQHTVSAADRIPPANVPSTWLDASGPWRNDVILLGELVALNKNYVAVFVEIKGKDGFDRIEVGALPQSRGVRREISLKPFYIAAIEVVRKSEAARVDYDTIEQTKKQGVLENALGLNSDDNALLLANQSYQVRITYDADRQKGAPGGPATDQKSAVDQKQSFWFRTDSQPPARLDPYVLIALPSDGEKHVFASEPVKVVFATNNLNLLFDAYGKKLQARLKPSSFRTVTPPAGVPHPFPINAASLQKVKTAVVSPWQDAVTDALVKADAKCVPVSGDSFKHTQITIPIPLELFTDYVLDIEMLDKGAADGSPGVRVWRDTFSTGGFRTLDEFAHSFGTVRVGHRGVHSGDAGKLQLIGSVSFPSRNPEGSELDSALQTAGLDALPVPKAPRAVVFWEQGAPDPQPVAILIDASEPMWRYRSIPTEVTDSGLAAAKRFEMVPTAWLTLSEQPGGDAIVDHIVPAPGGQRALVTLKPGARGKHIKLALRHVAFTQSYLDGPAAMDQFVSILDMSLLYAPWEELD